MKFNYISLALGCALLAVSCKKDKAVNDNSSNATPDSAQVATSDSASAVKTSATDSGINSGIMRTEAQDGKIVREVDAAHTTFPFTIGEEFTKDNQYLDIVIKNFEQPQLSAELIPENKEMNVRIGQIETVDNGGDGPFGQKIENYKVDKKGDVHVLIDKNNMAEGQSTGKFTVKIN